LTSQFPFHQDGDINYRRLYEKYNSDLANDYGNLVSRVMKLAFTHFDGKVPALDESVEDQSAELTKAMATTPDKAIEMIRGIDVLGAVDAIWNLIRCANRYFDYSKPWELAKKGQTQLLGTILYRSLETIRIVASLTSPIMPEKSEQVLGMLGFPKGYRPVISDIDKPNFLKPGTQLVAGENVFPRLQVPAPAAAAVPAPAPVSEAGIVTIDDFGKVKLRVAEVLACERVSDAKKLLKLQISVGEEQPRQIVAGIAEFYAPEQLVGKKIIVVANLKPTKIRGIDSNGMLLAAKTGEELALLTVDKDLPPGATIS
jgi:methionyl-tRNA synthetase